MKLGKISHETHTLKNRGLVGLQLDGAKNGYNLGTELGLSSSSSIRDRAFDRDRNQSVGSPKFNPTSLFSTRPMQFVTIQPPIKGPIFLDLYDQAKNLVSHEFGLKNYTITLDCVEEEGFSLELLTSPRNGNVEAGVSEDVVLGAVTFVFLVSTSLSLFNCRVLWRYRGIK